MSKYSIFMIFVLMGSLCVASSRDLSDEQAPTQAWHPAPQLTPSRRFLDSVSDKDWVDQGDIFFKEPVKTSDKDFSSKESGVFGENDRELPNAIKVTPAALGRQERKRRANEAERLRNELAEKLKAINAREVRTVKERANLMREARAVRDDYMQRLQDVAFGRDVLDSRDVVPVEFD